MDPWLCGSDSDRPLGVSKSHTFEDSFLPPVDLSQSDQLGKLSDSKEYIKSLEKKLEVLQGRKSSTPGSLSERTRLLSGLREAREAVIAELLKPDVNQVETAVTELSGVIETNLVLRRIAPEQPISKEEKKELVKEDLLQKTEEEEENLLQKKREEELDTGEQ